MDPTTRRRPQGFSLVEAMVSLAVLSVGILGVAKLQVHASQRNGLARRTAQAAAIARDFVENAQRWDFDDPRLASPAGCGQDLTTAFPVTDAMLGSAEVPAVKLDFSAQGDSAAASEATTVDALTLQGNAYSGAAPSVLAAVRPARFQLLWSARLFNPVDPTATTDCRTRLVTVVVRYPVAPDRFKNLITTFASYDRAAVTVGGIPEQI